MEAATIELWSIGLDAPPAQLRDCQRLLSADELARAARLRSAIHRRRWTVARGSLRMLLARHVDEDPGAIDFTYDARGKPELARYGDRPRLWFNLSHSGALALVAVTGIGPLGVDVEHVRELRDMEAVAQRCFSARERQAFATLAGDQSTTAFYLGWTRKEAYVKALGQGLSLALDSFDVSLLPGEPARLLAIDGDESIARQWSLQHVRPAPGYVGALAIRSLAHRPVLCRSWPGGARAATVNGAGPGSER